MQTEAAPARDTARQPTLPTENTREPSSLSV
jgi:hypothetical protein